MNNGGPADDRLGLAVRRRHDAVRRPGHGRGLLQLTRPRAACTTGRPSWPRRNGAAWAWFTGWFNFLGQVAVTAGIDFGCRALHQRVPRTCSGLRAPRRAHDADLRRSCCCCTALLNQFGVRLVALLNDVSVWWHIIGVLIIVGVLAFAPCAPPVGQLRLQALRQQHRLQQRALRRADRPAAGAVHLHRLRRLRAHDRGDPQRGRAAARAAS